MNRITSLTILMIFSLGLIVASCHSKDGKDKKTSIDNLFKQELENQENAKKGNKNPHVEIIDDPAKVEALRVDIMKKIKARNESEAEETKKNTTLWDRYKRNDKSVVPEMIAILRGNNAEARAGIYKGLERDYDDSVIYGVKEPELISQLLKGIENSADEKEAVQLAGLNKLPGYQAIFERRLLSGKSTEEARIFYWLSDEAKSVPALEFMGNKVRGKKMSKDDLDDFVHGLERYGEKGSDDIKKAVGESALFIYQNKLISDERIEDLKNSGYTSDAAEALLNCLFECGDKRVIPIANNILERRIRTIGPVKALIRLEGAKHLDKVNSMLKSDEDFFTGLDLVESIDRKWVTNDMLKEVLVQFAKQKNIDDRTIERVVRSYIKFHAEDYLKTADKFIPDAQLAQRIVEAYQLSQVSKETVVNDLMSLQVISTKPSDDVIVKLAKEAEGDASVLIYGILENENLFYSFDAETDFVPADYDKLLNGFVTKSKGVLKDIVVWMDARENKDGETFDYTVTVISHGKAFVAKPQDVGDWYDIMTVNAILEKVLQDLQSKERFVSIETGDQTVQYIFGNPEGIEKLAKKYKL